MKERPETASIPVILVTAKSRDEDVLSGYKDGATTTLQAVLRPAADLRRAPRPRASARCAAPPDSGFFGS